MEKSEGEKDITDDYQMCDKYGKYWGVLMDKDCQGATEVLHAVVPKKKTSQRNDVSLR